MKNLIEVSQNSIANLRDGTKGLYLQFASVCCNAASILLNKFVLLKNPTYTSAVIFYSYLALIAALFLFLTRAPWQSRVLKASIPIALMNAVGVVCMFMSIDLLHPTVFSLMSRSVIFFSIFLSYFILKETFIWKEFYWMCLAIAGMLVFLAAHCANDFYFLGIATTLLHSFLFALSNITTKRLTGHLNLKSLLFTTHIMTYLFLMVAWVGMAIFKHHPVVFFPEHHSHVLTGCSAGFLLVSMLLYFKGAEYISFKRSNIIRTISPLVLHVLSIPFFPLSISILGMFGMGICLVALYRTCSIKAES